MAEVTKQTIDCIYWLTVHSMIVQVKRIVKTLKESIIQVMVERNLHYLDGRVHPPKNDLFLLSMNEIHNFVTLKLNYID